jgi:hypothetical protein
MQPLFGRSTIVGRARAAVERACAGEGSCLLFTGEPGIGKSRLAEQVASEAASRGAAVAWGRCWEAGGAPAYWPWIQVFRELSMPDDPFAGVTDVVAVGAPEARFAAFDRAVRTLRKLAARRPLALMLDDLHAADAPSLWLLLLLTRELRQAHIVVVGAYRDAELRATPERAALLGKIAREAEVTALPRLGLEDVARWAAEFSAEASPAGAAELYRMTEGHPLFVVEALRLGVGPEARAAWSLGPLAVLDERLGQLGPDARTLLRIASVLGREFSLDLLAATAELPADRVHEALGEGLETHIIVPGGAQRFRFSHVLLRDRLYAELLPSARASFHFRAGTALARGRDTQTAAHHLFEGQSAGSPELIAPVALAAAEAALSRLAFEDAVYLSRRALDLPAEGLPLALRLDLELVEAEAHVRQGQVSEGKAASARAAAIAREAGARDLFARAALVYGSELASGRVDPHMVALLREALASLDETDSALRVRLMARLSAALTPALTPTDLRETRNLMTDALAMARRLGDRSTLLYALQFAATVTLVASDEAERLSALEEALALARALDQPLVLLHTMPAYLTALIASGERQKVIAALPSYAELARDARQPLHQVRYRIVNALVSALAGDLAEAERLGGEAEQLAASDGSGAASFLWLAHRFSLAQLLGRAELVAAEAPKLLARFGSIASNVSYLAWYLAASGRREEASERLMKVDLAAASVPLQGMWELMGTAEACVVLGDAELGARVYPYALRACDRMFWSLGPGAMLGPSARVLGDLALLIGRTPEALSHYEAALAFCEKMQWPLLIERCRSARDRALSGTATSELPNRALGMTEASAPVTHPGGQSVASLERSNSALRATPRLSLTREGEVWTLSVSGGSMVRLKHSKGVAYLQCLLERPGRELHVLEIAGVEHRPGDAGAVLDVKAKQAYRQRFTELREELAEAEGFGDLARAARAEREIDAIAEQLASAVGLGGRDRRAASDVERTRINVQRRLKSTIERIEAADPTLGRYLSAGIKTGTFCVYQPL